MKLKANNLARDFVRDNPERPNWLDMKMSVNI